MTKFVTTMLTCTLLFAEVSQAEQNIYRSEKPEGRLAQRVKSKKTKTSTSKRKKSGDKKNRAKRKKSRKRQRSEPPRDLRFAVATGGALETISVEGENVTINFSGFSGQALFNVEYPLGDWSAIVGVGLHYAQFSFEDDAAAQTLGMLSLLTEASLPYRITPTIGIGAILRYSHLLSGTYSIEILIDGAEVGDSKLTAYSPIAFGAQLYHDLTASIRLSGDAMMSSGAITTEGSQGSESSSTSGMLFRGTITYLF